MDDRRIESMFDSRTELIFIFAPVSRVALGPTQPPLQWIPAAVSAEAEQPQGMLVTRCS